MGAVCLQLVCCVCACAAVSGWRISLSVFFVFALCVLLLAVCPLCGLLDFPMGGGAVVRVLMGCVCVSACVAVLRLHVFFV